MNAVYTVAAIRAALFELQSVRIARDRSNMRFYAALAASLEGIVKSNARTI